MNDINTVCLTGRLYDIGIHPTNGRYPVVEAKISVIVGNSKDNGPLFDEFNIRSFGKISLFISKIEEGTYVMVSGKLKEDIRVNADNPETVRSKTYINIEKIKTFSIDEDNE